MWQASAHTLQYFTLAAALAPTVGGSIYLLFGWQGIAFLGAGAKLLQLLVLVTDETVQGQVVYILLYLTRRLPDDSDVFFEEVDEPESQEPSPERWAKSPGQVEKKEEDQMHPVLPGAPQDPEAEPKTKVAFEEDIAASEQKQPVARGRVDSAGSELKQQVARGRVDSGNPTTPNRSSHATTPNRSSRAARTSRRASGISWMSALSAHAEQLTPRSRRSRVSNVTRQTGGTAVSGVTWVTNRTDQTGGTAKTKGTFATNISKMTAGTFNSYALAQVDAPATSLWETAMPLVDEDADEAPPRIPSYIVLPLLAILSASFAGMLLVRSKGDSTHRQIPFS